MKPKTNTIGRKKAVIFYTLWMIIPMLHFAVFYIGVNFNSILLAFKKYDYGINKYIFSTDNFVNFINDLLDVNILGQALLNSIKVYLWGAVVGLVFGLLFAFYIYKKFIGSGFFKVVLFLPSIIPSIAMALVFLVFSDMAIPNVLSLITGKEHMGLMISGSKTVFPSIIFYNIWISFGISMLMYSSAMSRIPEDIVEYSRLDGVSLTREFFQITVPLIGSTIETFVVVGLAGLFVNQANILAFFPHTENMSIQTIGFYLFVQVSRGAISKYPYLAAGGLILTVITFPLTMIAKWLLVRIVPDVEY